MASEHPVEVALPAGLRKADRFSVIRREIYNVAQAVDKLRVVSMDVLRVEDNLPKRILTDDYLIQIERHLDSIRNVLNVEEEEQL